MIVRSHGVLGAAGLLLAALSIGEGARRPAVAADETDTAPSQSRILEVNPAAPAYPAARRGDTVDTYHGREVADPYRWLEELDSPETRAWITAENELTSAYLNDIPQRAALRARLTELWDYEKYGVPSKRGGRYFYSRNDGLQNQSVLYWAESLDAEPRVLLDPNALSADGTVALSGYAISDDGQYLAYGLASAGSDWQEWRVRQVDTAQDLSDHLRWIKFSGASWRKDGRGIYYSRYDEPDAATILTGVNYYQKLCYHEVGTPQSDDKVVYQRNDEKEWGFDGHVTDDGRYLIISVSRGTLRKNQVFYLDLDAKDSQVVELITGFDAEYHFAGNAGPVFYFATDLAAERYRVIAVDTRTPARDAWREIIAESDAVLDGCHLVGARLVVQYLRDATSQAQVFDLDGRLVRQVDLPGIGSAYGFGGTADDGETFFGFTSFTSPTAIYRYDVASGATSLFRAAKVRFSADDYETRQVWYASRDGTRVPMFVVARKGLALDGRNPTILYGYGGFNISQTPSFSPARMVWLELGGVYAVANLRGGGEYGSAWHEAGMIHEKQNVFDDFLSAAEYLVRERYTAPSRLAISGRSNGGLLVGAAMTQRPELFGAALPGVGVMDMLRFHNFTIGWAWVSEFGSSDDAKEFDTLAAYSPLHNIRAGVAYPATLITTADHDDRVVPSHSFKFAAALQAAQSGIAPTLIRIETSAGHGGGTPTMKLIDETADTYSFLVRALSIDVPHSFGEPASTSGAQ